MDNYFEVHVKQRLEKSLLGCTLTIDEAKQLAEIIVSVATQPSKIREYADDYFKIP